MKRTLRFAFEKTLPVLCGYVFLGFAFGILLQKAGHGWPWAVLTSLIVYAGSMQFVLIQLLTAGASLFTVAFMTLMINSRHIFYGLSFLRKYDRKSLKKAFPYMVFSLSDETFSLLCTLDYPADINRNRAALCIAAMNQAYWVCGSLLGGVFGSIVHLNLTGIDFSMTALFVVILVEQCRGAGSKLPAIIGGISALLCLVLFGTGNFLLPSLVLSSGALLALQKPLTQKGGKADV